MIIKTMAALALAAATAVGGVHTVDGYMERAEEHRALDTTVGIRDAIEASHTDDMFGLTVPDDVSCADSDCQTVVASYGAETVPLPVSLPAGEKDVRYTKTTRDSYVLLVTVANAEKVGVADTCHSPSAVKVYDIHEAVAPISTSGCIQ